jgi:UDP-N-acetylglucosamine--N-acetylmuramyl-(pentapeptide) pyrophosphoryl-undecaprenol N-acetylglucosamine transferase
VCELAAAGRFAVLVPFAAAAHGHQLHNARALAATGAALVLEESGARPDALASALVDLLGDPAALTRRGGEGRSLARRDAAPAVARLVMSRAVGRAEPGHATATTVGGRA